MSYTVTRGDTLYGIARQHGFRYWPNLYFAEENNEFRNRRPNPNRIQPGDVVEIPSRNQVIAALESRPTFRHTGIPLFPQATAATCWRAAAKMLFLWRHGRRAEAEFNRRIGARYRNMTTGLPSTRWIDFYCAKLGMAGTRITCENLMHYIIAIRSPAVVSSFSTNPNSGHAMLMAGYNLFRLQCYVLNPFAGARYDFDEVRVTASPTGGGTASGGESATYTPGAATESTMGYWIDISDASFRSEVFHY